MRNTKVAAPKVVGQRIPTTNSTATQKFAKAAASTTKPHAAAVPMTIFRELSSELQTTKESVASLTAQNQHLTEQNQLLRQELERIANRTQQAVKYLDNLQEQAPSPNAAPKPSARKPSTKSSKRQPKINPEILVEDYIDELPIVPEQFYRVIPDRDLLDSYAPKAEPLFNLPTLPKPKLVYERAIRKPLSYFSDAGEAEMSAWKMSLLIALIVCSAFGAGFLVVRPLIQGGQQQQGH